MFWVALILTIWFFAWLLDDNDMPPPNGNA